MADLALPRLNSRRAAFVDHVLSGHSPKTAARLAGYGEASATRTAKRLLRHPSVVAVLKAPDAEKQCALRAVDAVHSAAVNGGNADAALRAIELKSKLLGLVS